MPPVQTKPDEIKFANWLLQNYITMYSGDMWRCRRTDRSFTTDQLYAEWFNMMYR